MKIKKNCVNNLQEKKEAIGEIDRHRLTDIICILTISKIKLVEVVLPNVHLRYSGLPRQRTMKQLQYSDLTRGICQIHKIASKNTSCFPADHNSGNVYRLADNFSFATSVLLGGDILLQLWKRISISTHLELDDGWHEYFLCGLLNVIPCKLTLVSST